MKKFVLILVCLMISGHTFCKDSTAVSTQDSILHELQEIRSIQKSTYDQRMKAYEVREQNRNNKEESSPSEYAILYRIKNNTDFDFVSDSWSLYGLIALAASIIAAIYGWKQYVSQSSTEQHTKNAPVSVQQEKLKDLPRHFYRNLACTGALIFKFTHPSNGTSAKRSHYPSESNLFKLQTLPDDIFLPIDVEEGSYKEMHELKLLFRNYNTEVQVASEHLARPHLTDESLEQDFDNLLFKPLYLTCRIFKYQSMLSSDNIDAINEKAAYKIVNEHFDKLHDSNNLAILLRPVQNGYLNFLLSSNFENIKTIDKKGAIKKSLKKFVSNKKIIVAKNNCTKELTEYIKGISSDKAQFINWFNRYHKNNIVDDKATLSAEELYESLRPYLNYIDSENWDFETLFHYILAVDIVIETDRIGMINY